MQSGFGAAQKDVKRSPDNIPKCQFHINEMAKPVKLRPLRGTQVLLPSWRVPGAFIGLLEGSIVPDVAKIH